MVKPSAHDQVTGAVRDGWAGAGNFSATILSGFLIGFLLDKWLGTDPWLTVTFIIIAAVGGFYRMMAWYKEQNER
jgi:ATP synthase protein I